MKILIIKVQTIGDTLLIDPLIKNLSSYYSNSKIDVLINENTEDILKSNPHISKIISYKRESQRNISKYKRFIRNFKLLIDIRSAKYNLLIDLDSGDRGALLSKFSGAGKRIGSSRIKSNFLRSGYDLIFDHETKKHTVEKNLLPLSVLGIETKTKSVKTYWNSEDEDYVKSIVNLDKNFFHLHPFSKGSFKDINIELLGKIIDYCHTKYGLDAVITTSMDDRELRIIEQIDLYAKAKPIIINQKLSLGMVAFLNKKALFFIGADTAIMHISASNDTPTLAIFGPTSPEAWGPWDNQIGAKFYKNLKSLQKNGRHVVLSNPNYKCVPCNNNGCNNSLISDCLNTLDFAFLKQGIRHALNNEDFNK